MYCQYCGKQLSDNENYCSNCGNVIGNTNTNTATSSTYDPYPRRSTYQNQRKSIFVMTTSIIAIVLSSYAMFINCTTLAETSQPITFAVAVAYFATIAELVAGICGVVNWKNPKKMYICQGWGIAWACCVGINLLIALSTFSDYLNNNSFFIGFFFGVAISATPVVLYIVAVLNFKKQEIYDSQQKVDQYMRESLLYKKYNDGGFGNGQRPGL